MPHNTKPTGQKPAWVSKDGSKVHIKSYSEKASIKRLDAGDYSREFTFGVEHVQPIAEILDYVVRLRKTLTISSCYGGTCLRIKVWHEDTEVLAESFDSTEFRENCERLLNFLKELADD